MKMASAPAAVCRPKNATVKPKNLTKNFLLYIFLLKNSKIFLDSLLIAGYTDGLFME